jgi:uroporphyrinogen-III synthase
MKNTVKRLLFLNDLSPKTLLDLNTDKSILVTSIPLIQTSVIPYDSKELDPNIPWIFSSQTAVESLNKKEVTLPKKIYAIGQRTAEQLPHALIPEKATAKNLAQLIIDSNEQAVIFICGNRRRDELPELLKTKGIKVKEVVVYQTVNLQKTVNLHNIDGLAFMSPSAVHSLAQNGGFENLPCFAIGPTTAQALQDEGQDCVISKKTQARSIVDAAQQYFK